MPSSDVIRYTSLESPIGKLLIVTAPAGLREIRFQNKPSQTEEGWTEGGRLAARTARQLTEYFEGARNEFDLPVDPQGTEFQHRVWKGLQRIPFGKTLSYGELARRIGKPRAVRAVGHANGRNPIPIVIPCHRVIGHNGSLTGFGGGLHIKRRLLALESTERSLFA